jgi:hypothetical protein
LKAIILFDEKVRNIMNMKIDRKRLFIFMAFAYGISIALGLVIYFNGGLGNSPVVLPGWNLPFILMSVFIA